MADSLTTAAPTMCLTLYRRRPLLPWPAPATEEVTETMAFFGTLHALNKYLCAGWTIAPPNDGADDGR